MFDVVTLLDLLQQGWYATYPLFLCSVVGLAIAGERIWALRGVDARMGSLSHQVGFLMRRGDTEGVRDLIEREGEDLPLARVYLSLLGHARSASLDEITLLAEGHRLEQSQGLRRNVWILGTIGSAAPFIGLFGTVVGIMRAFHSMALAGAGGFAVVAAGISEALVATALGLAVAITAVAAYNYFQVRLGELGTTMRVGVTRFIDGLCVYRGQSGSRQVA